MPSLLVVGVLLWASAASAHKVGHDLFTTSSWVFNCTMQLRNQFYAQGFGLQQGAYQAHRLCACVVEKTVEQYSLAELQIFTPQQRMQKLEQHSQTCTQQLQQEYLNVY